MAPSLPRHRQSGRQDAALFLGVDRRAARARRLVGALAGPGERRELRLGDDNRRRCEQMDEQVSRIRVPIIPTEALGVERDDACQSPAALSRPAPENALQEWVVLTRVNKAGAGDDDPAVIEPIDNMSSRAQVVRPSNG